MNQRTDLSFDYSAKQASAAL